MLAGARYSMDSDGLTIKNITRADNGQYTCGAEVREEGNYAQKRITVVVHSKSILRHLIS